MIKVFQLTDEERDQLKELLNIGVSHASTTLSTMMKKRVSISVPSLEVKGAQTISSFISNPDDIRVAVLLRLSGALDGYVLLLFPRSAAISLLNSLSGKTIGDLRALDRFDRSIFQEVGNVLTGGMLQGLSRFLHINIVQSVPDVVIDMGGAMFNSISAAMIASHTEFLSLDVAICVDATAHAVSCDDGEEAVGRMFLFLGPDATKSILALTLAMTKP